MQHNFILQNLFVLFSVPFTYNFKFVLTVKKNRLVYFHMLPLMILTVLCSQLASFGIRMKMCQVDIDPKLGQRQRTNH